MTATISDNAMTILKKRYLVNGESVEDMFRRVAGGNEDYFQLMADLVFLPNSPALFNAGLNNGCTLSACFVFDVEDEMRGSNSSIVGTRDKAIAVAKAGGGVGYYFGNLRPKGSPIKSVHRVACGPVAVLRDYQAISKLITQGGKRELAQMGVLNCEHPDIREFIHVKDNDPEAFNSFNLSVGWSAAWLASVFNGHAEHGIIWDEQVDSAWSHGCPGMFFPDTVNQHNPNKHLGLIYAPNPCGETPNRNNEPCSLGSISLPRFFDRATRGILWGKLEDAVRLALRLLDDILDRNVFPHPDITAAALLTRKLGLGVMGWADLLAMMHIHYDTPSAVELGRKLMEFINTIALEESAKLAKEKGPYAGYSDKSEGPFARNESRTSIAPTGTISLLANLRGWSIEPWYAEENERTTSEGLKLQENVPSWIRDQLDGFHPKTALEIDWRWHIKHQAAFQRNTDLGVSKTINLPKSATRQDVSNAYRMMHELGCKGGTVFRDGCRSEQVLVTKKKSTYHVGDMVPASQARKMPAERKSVTHKFKVAGTDCFLTVGMFEDGTPGEIFLRASKLGSTVGGMLDSWAISFSIALQQGVPLKTLLRHHKGTRFEPHGLTDNPDLPSCTSIPDYVARWMEAKYLGAVAKADTGSDSGVFCPDCGAQAIYLSGCLTCPAKGCGWSRCG